MTSLNEEITPLVFFDPQYEKVADITRANKKLPLVYQTDQEITQFISEIERILEPNGYLCLWINKAVLLECRAVQWLKATQHLKITDLLIWKKNNFGFGSRFRNQGEFLLLIFWNILLFYQIF
ncbi:MAG: hypothetical protein mread185_000048 [Mycoplasmataceae bacterium]|nr:MAG: hypothetical protein mread185_000048 [Mycoplasmataceae bacterium]